MLESVVEGLDLFFVLHDLSVELITLALKLLLFLSGFDDVVGL